MTTETGTMRVDGTDTATRRAEVAEPAADGRQQDVGARRGGRLAGAAMLVAVAALGGTLWVTPGGGTVDTTRAEEAATARLEQQAEQHDVARRARSDRAATARLDAVAGRRWVLTAKPDESAVEAATARLERFAESYETGRGTRSRQAASDRLDRLAESVLNR